MVINNIFQYIYPLTDGAGEEARTAEGEWQEDLKKEETEPILNNDTIETTAFLTFKTNLLLLGSEDQERRRIASTGANL